MRGGLALLRSYLRSNIAAALEYRASTLTQIFGMFINNSLWVSFWGLYFHRFPIIKGWKLEDVLVLWSSVTVSWGLAAGVFGNSLRIPTLAVQGQLDYYLSLPRNVLWHLLISQLRLINIGDLLFGPCLLLLFVHLSLAKLAIFFIVSILAAVVTLAFFISVGSLVFFTRATEALSGQLVMMLVTFTTYPPTIFEGFVKVILYTLIPAGFISFIPVELVREFRWPLFFELVAAATGFLTFAIAFFYTGLRRYESGNLIRMRG